MSDASLKSWHPEQTNRFMIWLQLTRMVRLVKEDHISIMTSSSLNIHSSVPSAYGQDIEEDVIADTSGHFKKMLIVLLQVISMRNCQYESNEPHFCFFSHSLSKSVLFHVDGYRGPETSQGSWTQTWWSRMHK